MSPSYNIDESNKLFRPVWFNCHWVKIALQLYDGISGKHVKALKDQGHGYFFGILQAFSIDAAIIRLCKIYDKTSKRHPKHTILEMANYLRANLKHSEIRDMNARLFKDLGLHETEYADVSKLAKIGEPLTFELLDLILSKKPDIENNPSYKRILTYRDKMLAHQEQLDSILKEDLSSLPSLEEMERLNLWAYSFCKFFSSCLGCPWIIDSTNSARRAALNVIEDIIGFNDEANHRETEESYKN